MVKLLSELQFCRVPTGDRSWILFLSLYVNNISEKKTSRMPVFAIVKLRDTDDSLKLQKDTDTLRCWARKRSLRFQPVKCNIADNQEENK